MKQDKTKVNELKETTKDYIVEDEWGNTLYPESTSVVRKSNLIVNSIYCEKTSALAHKVLSFALCKVKYSKKENAPVAEFNIDDDFRDFLGIKKNTNSIYSHMFDVAYDLNEKKIILEDKENNKFTIMTLTPTAEFNNGKMTIIFNPKATELVLDLKTKYTSLFKGIYKETNNLCAIKLYEMLKSYLMYVDHIIIPYEIYDFKLTLGLIPNNRFINRWMTRRTNPLTAEEAIKKYYEQIDDKIPYEQGYILTKAIKSAIEIINNTSDIHVQYEYIKGYKGKVTGIRFDIVKKSKLKQISVKSDEIEDKSNQITKDEMFELICKLKEVIKIELTIDEFEQLLKCSEFDADKVINNYNLLQEKDDIDNAFGWLLTAIKEDYFSKNKEQKERIKIDETKKETKNKSIKQKPKNAFHNFQQRDYTKEEMDELEKKLLSK